MTLLLCGGLDSQKPPKERTCVADQAIILVDKNGPCTWCRNPEETKRGISRKIMESLNRHANIAHCQFANCQLPVSEFTLYE